MPSAKRALDHTQYERLLQFRVAMRRFNRWSEEQAAKSGLTHAQHQLLLAVCGHVADKAPTIGEIAGYLLVRHHSAVGLVDRVEALGLVQRVPDDDDQRVVRVELTELGHAKLEDLTELHIEELRRLAPMLAALVEEAGDGAGAGRGDRGDRGGSGGSGDPGGSAEA